MFAEHRCWATGRQVACTEQHWANETLRRSLCHLGKVALVCHCTRDPVSAALHTVRQVSCCTSLHSSFRHIMQDNSSFLSSMCKM